MPSRIAFSKFALGTFINLCALIGLATAQLAAAESGYPGIAARAVYQWAGPERIAVYAIKDIERGRRSPLPAGYLEQGTKVLPCIVERGGKPLANAGGTPYLGYQVVYREPNTSRMSAAERNRILAEQAQAKVRLRELLDQGATDYQADQRCGADYKGAVINARRLVPASRFAPAFRLPKRAANARAGTQAGSASTPIYRYVQDFHNSDFCADANSHAQGRRERLLRNWQRYSQWAAKKRPADAAIVRKAMHVDIAARTAALEGDRRHGCSAYASCEIDVILLSIRNRGLHPRCNKGSKPWGCQSTGDFTGIAAQVRQYNIWDRLFTISHPLSACLLRSDLMADDHYRDRESGASEVEQQWTDRYGRSSPASYEAFKRDQARFALAVERAEQILYAPDTALSRYFDVQPKVDPSTLWHYYHPPAMGKCFPGNANHEYISASYVDTARGARVLLGERVVVSGSKQCRGSRCQYPFELAKVVESGGVESLETRPMLPGALIAAKAISFKTSKRCTPYGVSRSCRFDSIAKHRSTPSWLNAGTPIQLTCKTYSDRPQCGGISGPADKAAPISLGGRCYQRFMPMAGVP